MSHRQQQQQYQRFQPPNLFSISHGEVTRIEPYGCFVKLLPARTTSSSSAPPSTFSISGLVHISQLYTSKVSNVSDIVSLNDRVWVKVIDIQLETIDADDNDEHATKRTRTRHKIKLSMKYVNQETGHDLDPDNALLEEDQLRTMSSGGGSGGRRNDNDSGANSLLGRALVSNIGMSTAIDPGNLILRGVATSRGTMDVASSSFNGYDLVGDDEGEPSPPPPLPVGCEPSHSSSSHIVGAGNAIIPMGRGRGMTLPAWMTKSDTTDDRLGSAVRGDDDQLLPPNDNTDRKKDNNDDNIEKRRRRDKRQQTTSSSTKERHGSRKTNNRHKERQHDHHRRRKRRRRSRSSSSTYASKGSRSLSQSSCSSTSYQRSRSRSVERSRSSHDPRKKWKTKKKLHKRDKTYHHRRSRSGKSGKERGGEYRRRSRSQSPSPSPPHGSSSSIPQQFANVEEARAILERLERRR